MSANENQRAAYIDPFTGTPIRLGNIIPSDLPAVRVIADDRLGPGYLDLDKNMLSDRHRVNLCALGGGREGAVVGFFLGQILPAPAFQAQYPKESAALSDKLVGADHIGVAKTVATAVSHERLGTATSLIDEAVYQMRIIGVDLVVAVAWKDGMGIHIDGPLRAVSFAPVTEIPDYWKEDSLARGYCCPTCGEPPCRCSAVLYILER